MKMPAGKVPNVGAPGRIHASQALARARRSRRGAQARHQPSAAGDQDRQGPWRLRPADLRGDLRGQCRPDAGGRAVRAGEGLPVRHLRRVVDQGGDPGIHPALVVAGGDGHLRKAQSKISVLNDGDMRLDQVKIIARRIGVTETDVIYMNRRLGGDASLNAAIREDDDSGEWQDWLVDESPDQETTLAASEEFDNRPKTLSDALTVLNKRERRIFETRRLAEEQIALVELAEEFGVSRERVRQIEVSAFKKVKNAVKHRVAAMATPAPLQVR